LDELPSEVGMAIRWDEIPHNEIRLEIYARLDESAIVRSAEDSLRHILRRRLGTLHAEDHRRFIELEARDLIEHLRCTRDAYREFVEKHKCQPVIEAYWVVLVCAIFPTAIAALRGSVVNYLKLCRVPAVDLALLFGIRTHTCYRGRSDEFPFGLFVPPDITDHTPATDDELQALGNLIDDHTLLLFSDIRDGGAVGHLFGGGPFAVDDYSAIRRSWELCGLPQEVTLLDWLTLREKLWHLCAPWTDGLSNLFGCIQEELLCQSMALPLDSQINEHKLRQLTSGFKDIMVPVEARLPLRLERGRDCEELAKEIGTIWHKCKRGGLSIAEIRAECSSFRIWTRVEVLSSEDADTFLHPGTWESGYENLLLGKLYANTRRNVAPGTINTWRKEYRAYLKWQRTNPSKKAEDFGLELQERKRSYRKSLHAK
jgi:hypothetical protein